MKFLVLIISAITILMALAYGMLLPEKGDHLEKPIIAHIFAEPARFFGKRVEIYGLVVESNAETEFLLQDVSQRPLRIRGKARIADQLTVTGSVKKDGSTIYLSAERIVPTKVLGGGGCC